ncbi:MAG TPA: NRDE family protein [Myxococcales bacterium]|nr:NRDE family protein [Myxococcales bacterium]
MCTLAIALRPSAAVTLALTGNRNEFLRRPASPPRVWPDMPGVLMPRDDQAGGTWLGLTARGLFVCLTNRRGAVPDPSRRSRGLLVIDMLRAPDAGQVREWVSAISPARYNGFHLVFADAREMAVAICDGERLEIRALAPGEPHLITERSYGAGEGVREAEVMRDIAPLLARPDVTAAMLRPPMQRHGPTPLEGACVHAHELGYGTRSSIQLVLRESRCDFLWTQGAPCTEPATDLSGEASALLGPAG